MIIQEWYEVAELYFKMLNVPVTLKPIKGASFGRPAKRPHSGVLVSTRMQPMRSFQEAFKDYVADLNEAVKKEK